MNNPATGLVSALALAAALTAAGCGTPITVLTRNPPPTTVHADFHVLSDAQVLNLLRR